MPIERATVNQKIQLGVESTAAPGTIVAATKIFECFDWQIGVEADVNFYRGTGHKFPGTQEENKEWSAMTIGGNLDYNGLPYLMSSIYGSITPVAAGASTTAKKWIATPPLTGPITPQTYTIEQGDPTTRAHRFGYGLITKFGYKGTRKDFTVTADGVGQALIDGVTLASTGLTTVPIAPVVSKHVNVYLDSTFGGLGTTQLLKVLSVDFLSDMSYDLFYPLNRSQPSFTSQVDVAPKTSIKLKVEADSFGMALLGYLRAGTLYYLRVDCVGNVIDVANSINNGFQHDMAIAIGKPTKFADDAGIFAIEWDCMIMEDATWGKAHTMTATNLITAL